MKDTLEDVQGKVDSYLDKWTGLKYVVAKEAEEELRACLEELDRQLNLVSTAISGQTYVEVLKSHGMLEELKLGVFGTETHLAKIRGEMATAEQMDAMGKRMMGKLEEFSSAQEELGRGQAAMDGKLDAAGKERAEMRGEINANIEGVSKKQDDLLRKQAAMNGKHDAAGKEQAEMRGEINAKLDGLAASKEMQGKRQRAKIEREAALEDAEIAEADIVLDPNAL
ncbi:hypothetical protein TeGR_g1031, partial [Tetraparma gracilis]